jgi:type IV pilus assembly protein PilP
MSTPLFNAKKPCSRSYYVCIRRGMFSCVLMTVFCIVGCSSERDIQTYIREVKLRHPVPIKPLPKDLLKNSKVYPNVDGMRNPFKPVEHQSHRDSSRRNKHQLESFPLDSLEFVGTIVLNQIKWALIKMPSGIIARAKTGDYLGTHHGELSHIETRSVEIVERIKISGNWETKAVVLHLSS